MGESSPKPMPEAGEKAPAFSLADSDGETVRLSEHKGHWVVLFFYSKDDTPGCTTEAAEFSGALQQFEAEEAVVLGVSPDTVECHAKFRDKHSLTVRLLADPKRAALEKYGAWQIKKNYGKEYWGVQRSTFLIDPHGKVAHVWPNVRVKGHVPKVLETLQAKRAEANTT